MGDYENAEAAKNKLDMGYGSAELVKIAKCSSDPQPYVDIIGACMKGPKLTDVLSKVPSP